MIALVNYMTQISLALVVVANLVTIFTKAAASSQRINEIFDTKPSVVGAKSAPSTKDGAPAVEFRDVSFSYLDGDDAELSLENVSFTLAKGEVLGIIGGTGSGKSSLVNMICRFYDPEKGEVLINGRNVNSYGFEELRKKIGIVPQKAVLFHGTIRQNLQWGCANASDEELHTALKSAQALDVVKSKPNGLDETIAEGGRNFSGGQRQRLTIARALVRQPEFLILDDSASALDYATDAALRQSLKALPYRPTIFIVSQRTASIQHADKILVLDDGALAGVGTHQTLLQSCPVYQEIYASQFPKEEVAQNG